MIKTALKFGAPLLAMGIAAAPAYADGHACKNETWKKVMERGKVVVGVKADYKPWGYRDKDGSIVGMEIDVAQIAADAMGVKLETVAVQSSNRMQFLEQGKIDMMIATMSDRADRRKIVGITQPNYYTSGTNIMSPKALKFTKWEDLKGKKVVVAFTGNAEAKQALRDKKCVAWVYDDSSIGSDLSSGNFPDFEMPLASEDDNPWGLAVPLAEKDCVFGHFMSGLTFNLHQSGKLIELEKKWGIKATSYLADKQKQYGDWIADKK